MKKTLLVIAVVVLAISALGAGVVYAQGGTPPSVPYGTMMGERGGNGLVHTYVVDVFAAKFNLTDDAINARLTAGETMYEIALSQGITSADLPAFMTDVHTAAFAAAVKDGVITQAQADFMLQRMAQNGYGDGSGSCLMGGGGYGFGRGMMSGWGAGQYQTQNP